MKSFQVERVDFKPGATPQDKAAFRKSGEGPGGVPNGVIHHSFTTSKPEGESELILPMAVEYSYPDRVRC
jgi:hypothetical protein